MPGPAHTTAAALLRQRFGEGISLGPPALVREGGRNTVYRCVLERDRKGSRQGARLPATVIVKALKPGSDLGLVDWTCLHFLDTLRAGGASGTGEAGGAQVAPRVYAADVAARVVVMEDLGGSRSLDDLLHGHDRHAAEGALRRMAQAYAALHAATTGAARGRRFGAQQRALLPPTHLVTAHDRRVEAQRWLAGQTRLRAWWEATGCPWPPGAAAATAQIARTYAAPGPFLALTHGDPAPTNTHISAGGTGGDTEDSAEGGAVRLVDFEYGAYRHALYDVTAWDVLCPLPADLVALVQDTHRTALARACPVARDAARYHEAWAHLAAYRALAMLTWIPLAVLQEDRPWVESWTCRQAALAVLSRLERNARTVPALAPLATAASTLFVTLARRWPDVARGAGPGETSDRSLLPQWPALA